MTGLTNDLYKTGSVRICGKDFFINLCLLAFCTALDVCWYAQVEDLTLSDVERQKPLLCN